MDRQQRVGRRGVEDFEPPLRVRMHFKPGAVANLAGVPRNHEEFLWADPRDRHVGLDAAAVD